MSAEHRFIHSGFETLRLAAQPARSGHSFRRADFVTNEQIIARGTGASSRISRPLDLFAEFQRY